MTSSAHASYALTSRYATALIELAQDSGKTDAVERDLTALENMIGQSRELAFLVRFPLINRTSQLNAITALAQKAGFDKITQNFLGVLIQNRRLNAILNIISTVRTELSKRRGEITVKVETAQDLTPAQLKALQEALAKGVGAKISIQAKVEPSIMGGMIVTVGSQMIDDSVRHKLERLKAAMAKQANENTSAKAERA